MSRYTIDRSTRENETRQPVEVGGERVGVVTIDTFTLIDTRNGTRYPRGAWKVIVTGPADRPRSKTFRGETAWYKAESYARDAVSWLQRYAA